MAAVQSPVANSVGRWFASTALLALAACAGPGPSASGGTLGQKLDAVSDDTSLDARIYSSYFALGDSFSSGNGALTTWTDCGRAPLSWPNLLQGMLNPNKTKPNIVVSACSGATTQQVLGPDLKNNQPAQISAVQSAGDRDNSLITVTIGGNDANVLPEFLACATGDCSGDGPRLTAFIDTDVYPRLVNTFTALRTAAPKAVILAVGYPHLVAPEGNATCDATELGQQIDGAERTMIRSVIDYMNTTIENAAADGGITAITDEVVAAFETHEACSGPESFFVTGDEDPALPIQSLGHPNVAGNKAYAAAVLQGLSTRIDQGPGVDPEPESTLPVSPNTAPPTIIPPAVTPAPSSASAWSSTPAASSTPAPTSTAKPASTPPPVTNPVPASTPAATSAAKPVTPAASAPVAASTPAATSAPKPATAPVAAAPAAAPAAASAPRPATPPTAASAPATSAPKPATTPAAASTPATASAPKTSTTPTSSTSSTPKTDTSDSDSSTSIGVPGSDKDKDKSDENSSTTTLVPGSTDSDKSDEASTTSTGILPVVPDSDKSDEASTTSTGLLPVVPGSDESGEASTTSTGLLPVVPGSDESGEASSTTTLIDPSANPTGPAATPTSDPATASDSNPTAPDTTDPAQIPVLDPNLFDPSQFDPSLFDPSLLIPEFDPNQEF